MSSRVKRILSKIWVARRRTKRRLRSFEQLEKRELLVAAVWNNVINPLNVDGDAGGFVSPVDVLVIVNELNGPKRSDPDTGKLPKQVASDASNPFLDVSCDNFVSPLDALIVVNYLNSVHADDPPPAFHSGGGTYAAVACSPQLLEGTGFNTELSRVLTLPDDTSAVELRFQAPAFDMTSKRTIRDAFEFEITDTSGNPLVLPYKYGEDAAYNWSEDLEPVFGPGMRTTTQPAGQDSTATINLSGLPAGSRIRVTARLVNNDADDTTSVILRGFEVVDATEPAPTGFLASAERFAEAPPVDLASLSDVTASLVPSYGRTTLSGNNSELVTDLRVTNRGSQAVIGQLIVAVGNISELQAAVLRPDGYLADGRPFFDLTPELDGNPLGTNASSRAREIRFRNESGQRFTYQLTTYGSLNLAPTFESTPNRLIAAGRNYRYAANASDPESQPLHYSVMSGPQGLAIDSASGVLTWQTAAKDIGSHRVVIRATDPHGLFAEQAFAIEVREVVSNRPPVILSSPTIETTLDATYTYEVNAIDVDADVLSYALTTQPAGMSIDSSTGLISWKPTADQIGIQNVALQVSDGRGGVATQEFELRVYADPNNTRPVIVSEPVVDLFVPGFSNPASGSVTPQRISLDVGSGATFEGTVSIRLPDDTARFADIVLAVDESSSMGGDQAWVAEMIPLLDSALKAQGIGDLAAHPNRFAVVGFGGGREQITVGHFLNQQQPTKYTLYGANNAVVASGLFDAVVPEELLNLVLPQDGRYVLVVEAANPADLPAGIGIGIEGKLGAGVRQEQLVLGKLVDDRLSPGQPVQYTFSLTTPTLLYFDSLEKDSRVQWSLSGPSGPLASNVRFDQSDVSLAAPVWAAPTGAYTLTIDSPTDVGADYRFRLLDLPDVQHIASGQKVTGELVEKNETFAYRFQATQGQRFELVNSVTAAHSDSKWRLVGPDGALVVLPGNVSSRALGTNQAKFGLPVAGEYYLLIEGGQSADEGNAAVRVRSLFEFTAKISDPAPPTAIAIGDTVNGSIHFVGEFTEYSFSLTNRTNLYLDSFANNALTWTLVGPAGARAAVRFDQTDSVHNGNPVLDLVAGNYTLRVDSNGLVGSFAFRLFDLKAATVITPGAAFSGELTVPSETDFYQFNVSAPGQVYIDVAAASDTSNIAYRIYNTFGLKIFESTQLRDAASVALPAAGTYTLLVEGRRDNADRDTYTMNVVPIASSTQALALGSITQGSLATAGQTFVYTFAVADDRQLYFDALTNDANLVWTLDGPTGRIVDGLIFTQSDSQDRVDSTIDVRGGGYRLTIGGLADKTGDFSFAMLDFANPAHSTAITPSPGAANPSVTFAPASGLQANQTQIFRYTAAAGDEFSFITAVTGSTNSYYRIVDANGTEIVPRTAVATDQLNKVFTAGGTYYLLMEGRISDTVVDNWSIAMNFIQNRGPTTLTGTPLTLGTTTSGNLSVAAQVDSYIFTVATRGNYYFDSLTNNSSVRWSLRGPTGTLVSNRAFNATDAHNQTNVAFDLIAGNYQLQVEASGGAPGAYGFRMHALSSAPPLNFGTAVSGDLTPANETDLYKFDAAAGEQFYFDVEAASDVNNSLYRVIDPFGRTAFTANDLRDFGPTTLDYTGSYTLLVEGWRGNADVDTYAINVHRLPVVIETPLTFGETINASFKTPGETAVYTFSVTDYTQVHFDSLVNSSTYTWTLSNAFGPIVNARQFRQSDSFDVAQSVIELPAGDYRLTVAGIGETQEYSFRLLNLMDAMPVQTNTLINDKLDRFADAPARFSTLTPFVASTSSIDLSRPSDAVYLPAAVLDGVSNWSIEFWYKTTKTGFQSLMSGANSTTADGNELLIKLANDTTFEVGNNTVVGSWTIPSIADGQWHHYALTMATGTGSTFYLDGTSQGTRTGTLGTLAIETNGLIVGQEQDKLNGRFDATQTADGLLDELRVWQNVRTASEIQDNRLQRIATTTPGLRAYYGFDEGSGNVVSDKTANAFDGRYKRLSESGSSKLYRFAVNAGDIVLFDSNGFDNSFWQTPNWRVIDQYGNQLFSAAQNSDFGPVALVGGSYTLMLQGRVTDIGFAGEYSFEIVQLDNAITPTLPTPLTLGDVIQETIAKKFENDAYTFTLTQDSLVYFDSLTNDASLTWSLASAARTLVSGRRFDQSDSSTNSAPVLSLKAGVYVLSVVSSEVKPYSFSLQNLSAATAVALGTPFSGTLSPGSQTDLYQFSATAGQPLYLDVVATSSASSAYLRIVDAHGNIALQRTTLTDMDTFTLPNSGNYYLLVEGLRNATASTSYEINLLPAVHTQLPLVLGDIQSQSIVGLGGTVEYAFDLTSTRTLYFDSFTNSSTLLWTLNGPSGIVVNNRRFDSSDSFNFETPLLKSLAPGAYRLTVDATGETLGAFSFRLLDIDANATPITLDSNVSGQLTIPSETDVYQFDAVVGQRILVDMLAASDTNNSLYRIFDPLGNEIFELRDLLDAELAALPGNGKYTLLIEGWRQNTDQDTYEFNLRTRNSRAAALTLGAVVNDTLAIGEEVKYAFDVPNDMFVVFDSLTNQSRLSWSLTGPTGKVVTDRAFNFFQSNTSAFELRAGSYVLTVDGATDFAGAFGFSLTDIATATPIAPGTQISDTLDPGVESHLYKFAVSAGDSFSFDSISTTNNLGSYRVIDPYGRVVFTQTINVDRLNVELGLTGTYTLQVEGRNDASVPNTYRLDVLFNGNTPPAALTGSALTLGATQAGNLSTAAQVDSYRFTLTERALVHMDVLTNSSSFRWSLRGPRGVEISNLAFTSSDSFDSNTSHLDLFSGDYQLDIFASSGTPGAYAFTLHALADAIPVTPGALFPLAPNNTVGVETDLYRFSASAGDRFLIDILSTGEVNNTEFKLIDQYGTFVLISSGMRDMDQIVIPHDGVYTLLVEGDQDNSVADEYSLRIVPIVTSTVALMAGASNTDVLDAGEEVVYTFTISDPSLFLFSPQTSSNLVRWTLAGDAGAFVVAREFDDGLLPIDLLAGNYTLTVDGLNDYAGAANFTALLADFGSVLSNGSKANTELTTARAATIYQFQGTAGQHFALLPDYNLQFADSATAAVTAGKYVAASHPEDGWSGIDVAYRADVFREGAAINYIVVTDEDRDIQDDNLDFAQMFGKLAGQSALLNMVVSNTFRDGNNAQVLGVDNRGNAYKADGAGGFTITTGGFAVNPQISVKQDYIDLAWALEGAAWDLNLLRNGGLNAQSFTNAFIDVKVAEILEQTALRLVASSPVADFAVVAPVSGQYDTITGGQTYDFDVRIGNDGRLRSYDLLFKQGQTIGSIPVYIISPYEYGAMAVDADGDALKWSIVQGPAGLVIDPATGMLAWPVDGVVYGEHPIRLRVEDGRGGFDEQSFELSVNSGPSATLSGKVSGTDAVGIPGFTVYLDQNRNGLRDASEMFTATDNDGNYTFDTISLGTYVVALEPQPGWQLVTPEGGLYEVAAEAGQVISDLNFSNKSISIVNTNPRIASLPPASVVIGQSYVYAPTIEEFDGDALTFDVPLAPTGMAVNPSNGTIRWTPGASQVGVQNVLLRVRDGRGGFDLQYFAIDVAKPNTPPVIVSTPAKGPAGVGLKFVYSVDALDADGDALTYSLINPPAGAAIDPTTGVLNWRPQSNQTGAHTMTVQVDDGRGGIANQTIELPVEVAPANAPPVFRSQPPTEAQLGDTYLYRVQVDDPNGDPVTLAIDTALAGMTFIDDDVISWTPTANQLGQQTLRISADDGRGGVAEQEVEIRVGTRSVNAAPRITSPPIASAVVGARYSFTPTAEDANGDTLIWSLEEAPGNMSIDPATGRIDWLPGEADLGPHKIILQVMDTHAAYSQLVYTLRVRAVNSPPVIQSSPVTDGAVGATYFYQVAASDPDQDPLRFSLTAAPAGMTINATTGRIVWTPVSGQNASHAVAVTVTDSAGARATQNFTIEVASGQPNQLPEITSAAKFFATVGQLYTYDVEAVDLDGDAIAYSLLTAPVGMTIHPQTGLIAWTPTSADIGTRLVEVAAKDPSGGGSLQGFGLQVRAVNNPPVIVSTPPQVLAAGAALRYDVLATDADGDFLTYELVSGPAGMVMDGVGRMFWVATAEQAGSNAATLRVSDGRGGVATQTLNIDVQADTQAPRVAISLSSNPVKLGQMVDIRVSATDNVGVKSLALTLDGVAVPLDSKGMARVQMNSVGSFVAAAVATDAAGNSTPQQINILVADPNDVDGPTLRIASPSDGGTITAPTDVIGTVLDATLVSYRLRLAEFGSNNFKTIATGTENVDNARLGEIDPTLLQNGSYVLRLEAIDAGGRGSVLEQVLEITGDLKLGNFRLSFTDMVIPVSGIPIEIERIYDTLQAEKQGDLGFGWQLEYRNTNLQVGLPKSGLEDIGIHTAFRPGVKVYLNVPGVGRQGFTFDPDIRTLPGFGNNLVLARPKFTPDPGVMSRLSPGTSGYLQVNEFGELYAPGGIPYNPASPDFGGAYVLTTPEGITYRIDGTSGNLRSAATVDKSTLTFSDDGIRSSELGVQIEFRRNAQGQIVEIVDQLQNSLKYEYSSGRLVASTDREGNRTTYSYDSVRSNYLAGITDPLGRMGTRYEYGADGRITAITNSEGNRFEVSFELGQKTQTFRDPLGRETIVGYDNQGNVTRQVDAMGGVTQFEVDSNGNETRSVDPLGNTLLQEFDSSGRLTKRVDAMGSTTRIVYDSRGYATKMVNAAGDVVEAKIGADGNLTKLVAANGSSISYSGGNKPTAVEFSDGTQVQYTYNSRGDARTHVSPQGVTTSYGYDQNGNVLSQTVSDPNSNTGSATESYTYDRNGRLTSQIDANGVKTVFEYDELGYEAGIARADGTRTTTQRDARGLITSRTATDGTTLSVTYDAVGNPISQTNALGITTHFVYDALNRQVEVIYPDDTPDDLSDNPRSRKEYDAAGRLIATIDELGNRIELILDAVGRVIVIRDPLGNETRRSYDVLGRVVETMDPTGGVYSVEYDLAGNVAKNTFPDGTSVRAEYNELGQVTRQIDQNGYETRYSYDGLGQLIEVEDAAGQRTRFAYDGRGALTVRTDALGRRTEYAYDNLGRMTSETLPGGQITTFAYDQLGRLKSKTDANGITTNYSYDAADRPLRKSLGDATISQFSYDALGRLVTETNSEGTGAYEYDVRDRLIAYTSPIGEEIRYAYDAAGRLIQVASLAGTTAYEYDAAGRMLVSDSSGIGRTVYTYDTLGNVVHVEQPNGVSIAYDLDAMGRILEITHLNQADVVLASFSYTLDATGRRIAVEEAGGRNTNWEYDSLYRLTQERVTTTGVAEYQISYRYDAVGNRTFAEHSTTGLSTYTYDSNDRLITLTDRDGVTNFEYDANGNLISKTRTGREETLQWDANDRLTRLTISTAGSEAVYDYSYDAAGRRISLTSQGVRREFLLDVNAPLPVVLAELADDGNVVKAFTYGLDRISQASGDETYILGYDAHSGTRILYAEDGAIVERYAYDAFGDELLVAQPLTEFLYRGEQRDLATGYDYLRARYYAPGTGLFVSRDPFEGVASEPGTLNEYSYVTHDPINFSDPTGRFKLAQFLVSFTVKHSISVGLTVGFIGVRSIAAYKSGELSAKKFIEIVATETAFAVGFGVAGRAIPIAKGLIPASTRQFFLQAATGTAGFWRAVRIGFSDGRVISALNATAFRATLERGLQTASVQVFRGLPAVVEAGAHVTGRSLGKTFITVFVPYGTRAVPKTVTAGIKQAAAREFGGEIAVKYVVATRPFQSSVTNVLMATSFFARLIFESNEQGNGANVELPLP